MESAQELSQRCRFFFFWETELAEQKSPSSRSLSEIEAKLKNAIQKIGLEINYLKRLQRKKKI